MRRLSVYGDLSRGRSDRCSSREASCGCSVCRQGFDRTCGIPTKVSHLGAGGGRTLSFTLKRTEGKRVCSGILCTERDLKSIFEDREDEPLCKETMKPEQSSDDVDERRRGEGRLAVEKQKSVDDLRTEYAIKRSA